MIEFPAFRRSDVDDLESFLTGEDWLFHAGGRPTSSQVRERVAAGRYDGDGVLTSWVTEDGDRVGLVRIEDLGDDTPVFDLRLRAAARGRGLGRRTVTWLTAHVFSTYPHVRRVEATTRQDNLAMRRVLLACGYVKEAHYRDAWPAADGEMHDAVGYAVTRHDWTTGSTTPVVWED